MKESIFIITGQRELAPLTYEMTLKGDTGCITRPGQFVNIQLDGFFLRRPISVCDCVGDRLVIIYKVVGEGTLKMFTLDPGTELNILTGLGNGYDTDCSGDHPVLLGGGAGVPPMYWLAKILKSQGKNVTAILGFNSALDVFYEDEFRKLGCETIVTTVDGSYGTRGFVTDALPDEYTYFYACGPGPMLKAVYKATVTSGEMSFEERMGCGFGACMGCTCRTVNGYKRICKDGPVLKKEEILWED